MGAANVIPGVSGGTIAFISGIYERLINSLKAFDIIACKLLISGKWKAFAAKTDLFFLLAILAGTGASILSLAKVMELAFLNYEVLTLAFFFGLIVASILGVGRQIGKISFLTISGLLVGIVIAAGIAFLPPAEADTSILYLIISGAIAICSMILPGLSGSYILLLMGNYILVLQAISSFNFNILIPVAVGCILGLLLFSRLLSYLFAHFRDVTISLLTGFVAGSLAIIWPWKITEYITVADDKQKAAGYIWFLPDFDLQFLLALVLAVVGFLIVWWLEKFSSTEPRK